MIIGFHYLQNDNRIFKKHFFRFHSDNYNKCKKEIMDLFSVFELAVNRDTTVIINIIIILAD